MNKKIIIPLFALFVSLILINFSQGSPIDLDFTPPDVTANHDPQTPLSNQQVTFTATATDASGISQIQIFVDNELVQTCEIVTLCIYTSDPYSSGEIHEYYASAIDNSANQNQGYSPTYNFFVRGYYYVYNDTVTAGWWYDFAGGRVDYNNQEVVYRGLKSIKTEEIVILDFIFPNSNLNYSKYGALQYAVYADPTNNFGNLTTSIYNGGSYYNSLEPGWNIINVNLPKRINPSPLLGFYIDNEYGNELLYFDEMLFLERNPFIESIPPNLSIDHFPKDINYTNNVTFIANASDASGIQQIQIVVDGVNVKTCNGVTSCSYTQKYMPNTFHTYYAYANDNTEFGGNLARDPPQGDKSFTVNDIIPIEDYSDVLVVINMNSQISEEVGTYFAESREIPDYNIVRVNTRAGALGEEITPEAFNMIRYEIEDHIHNYLLEDKINYIVTTKGFPLKIKPEEDDCNSFTSECASVESELSLILGPYSDLIGEPGRILSPYKYRNSHFSKDAYGIYLVTRLDGYNFEQITDMINKSSSPIQMSDSNKFVFDQDPDWNSITPSLNTNMQTAHNILTSRGYNSFLDTSTVFIVNETNVTGYVSWGSNDHYDHLYTQNAKPGNTWQPGAIAETYVSSSGRTFTYPPVYGQSLIADLIEEGITGAKGYVYEPFADSMADVGVLFDRYTNNYNLAESFYIASPYLSWMDVVVGDPKTSIIPIGQDSGYVPYIPEEEEEIPPIPIG